MKNKNPYKRFARSFRYGALFSVFFCAWAVADSSKSSFELDGTKQEFSEVSAFRIRDQRNVKAFKTLVLLTKTTPDRASIAEADDPYGVAINDPATDEDYLALFVEENGTVGLNASIGGIQYLDSSGMIMGDQGSLSATCSENSEKRIACEVSTTKAVTTPSGSKWSFSAVFAGDVLSRTPGKPVEAGGGEPGKTLSKLNVARKGDDLESILSLLVETRAEDFRADWHTPEKNLASVKDLLNRMLPVDCVVVEGEYRGDDEVSLMVKGTIESWGEKALIFRISLQRSEGHWLFERGDFVAMAD